MIIKTKAYPRAALIGNPSDGYFGKTIAFTFSNFQTDVTLYPSEEIRILPTRRDRTAFEGIDDFSRDVSRYGYYGGTRVIKAAIARFLRYCGEKGIRPRGGNFTIRCHTSIPTHLGLAGSSSIITAVFRALMRFYGVEIPRRELPGLVLRAETEELGIGGGLQDRVAQCYEGMTYMDFDEALVTGRGYGKYLPMHPAVMPNLYLAYSASNAETSDILHNDLRYRFDNGDAAVRNAMTEFAALTEKVKAMFDAGNFADLPDAMNANYNLRSSICAISRRNAALVAAARSAGASAKFTGSGGAVIGTYTDDSALEALKRAMAAIGAEVIVPEIAWPCGEDDNGECKEGSTE